MEYRSGKSDNDKVLECVHSSVAVCTYRVTELFTCYVRGTAPGSKDVAENLTDSCPPGVSGHWSCESR